MEYITAIWYILWLFGKLVVIWYISRRFGIPNKEKSGNPEKKQKILATICTLVNYRFFSFRFLL
jgi:hypothetical protein